MFRISLIAFLKGMSIFFLICFALFNILISFTQFWLRPYEILLALDIQGVAAQKCMLGVSIIWGLLIFILLRMQFNDKHASAYIAVRLWQVWILIHLAIILFVTPYLITFLLYYFIALIISLVILFLINFLDKNKPCLKINS